MESAVAFYEKLERDEALATHIQELGDKEKISAYVMDKLGYEFTREEMQKVVFERNPEMSDEELEAVIGGKLDPSSILVGASIGLSIGIAIFAAAAA